MRRLKSFRFWLTIFFSVIAIGILCLSVHVPLKIVSKAVFDSNVLFKTTAVPFVRFNDNGLFEPNSDDSSESNKYGTLDPNPTRNPHFRKSSQTKNRLPGVFSIGFNGTNGNYTEFWRSVRDLATDDCLYPRSYDVTQVTGILRRTKIIHADLFPKQTSLKLKIEFEGHQSAIFKIMLIERENKSNRSCNTGCEHPEYEAVAFALNRMFDLRNMPYTTGRVLSWFDELKPVATPRLREFIQVENDISVCFNWKCLRGSTELYCFRNGMILGTVVYFIEDRYIKTLSSDKNLYHGYHIFGATSQSDLNRLPGDKKFCERFRNDFPYKYDQWFLDIVDIAILDYLMSHIDAKHTVLVPQGKDGPLEFNVMIDFGHAFCRHEKLTALAPLIQCCRIRTRVFQAMVRYKDTFEETFLSLTRDDPLHPLLIPENMDGLKQKLKQTLALVDFCRNLDGDSNVFVDL